LPGSDGRSKVPGMAVAAPITGGIHASSLVLAASLMLCLCSCGAKLKGKIESEPAGAAVRVEGRSTGRTTPASVSERFPPRETADGFASFDVELERGGQGRPRPGPLLGRRLPVSGLHPQDGEPGRLRLGRAVQR
jgi:hypothetical protein